MTATRSPTSCFFVLSAATSGARKPLITATIALAATNRDSREAIIEIRYFLQPRVYAIWVHGNCEPERARVETRVADKEPQAD